MTDKLMSNARFIQSAIVERLYKSGYNEPAMITNSLFIREEIFKVLSVLEGEPDE